MQFNDIAEEGSFLPAWFYLTNEEDGWIYSSDKETNILNNNNPFLLEDQHIKGMRYFAYPFHKSISRTIILENEK